MNIPFYHIFHDLRILVANFCRRHLRTFSANFFGVMNRLRHFFTFRMYAENERNETVWLTYIAFCNCIMWVTHDVFSTGNLAHSRQWRDQDKKTFPPKSLKHLHCHVYNIEFTLSNNNFAEKFFTRYWPTFADVLILWDQTRGEDYYLQIQCLKLSSETSSYLVGSVTTPGHT